MNSSPNSSHHPLLLESGTEEYRKKKRVETENIDHKGIFRRSRVIDQTQFDLLFIEDRITRKQYSAAEMYLHLMTISGCFLKSASLEPGIRVTGRDVAGAMAGKILVISSARGRLRESGPECLIAVETCLSSDVKVNVSHLKKGLNSLVRFFRL
jgi:hypothetical protein|tara:strand:+ start:2439 stop:2900 length:462 start_codon:yes stop_codon:yes gene_type:complete